MFAEETRYTMEDLTRATGFTARTIRYYITRDLVPGAGERGPNVTYSRETLERLELIKRLKSMKVQPAGRSLTLDEIRSTIASLGDAGTRRMVAQGMEMSIIDTEEPEEQSGDMVCEETQLFEGPPTRFYASMSVREREPIMLSANIQEEIFPSAPHDFGDLGPLLRSLNWTLAELLDRADDDTQNTPPRDGAEVWHRVRTPDIEIQVRTPDDKSRRERLERIHRILTRLLDQRRYGE